MPTYNILDGAQILLEANKVGQRLVGEFGVKAILPREFKHAEFTTVCCVAHELAERKRRHPWLFFAIKEVVHWYSQVE